MNKATLLHSWEIRKEQKKMLDPKQKKKIIKKFQTHENDTGSSEVQIAILTEEIKMLTEHLRQHRKDFSSRRGLIKKVNERRKLLRYLEREDEQSYLEMIKKLNLKPVKKIAIKEEDLFEEESEESEEEETGGEKEESEE